MKDFTKDKDVMADSGMYGLEEPRLPELTDYADEDLNAPTTSLHVEDEVDIKPVDAEMIEHVIKIDVRAGTLAFEREGVELARSGLSFESLRALYHPSEKNLYEDGGIKLRMPKKDLLTPMGFEALLHAVMMNMISFIYPRICRWSPLRKRLNMFNLKTEVNHIRNGVHINDFNHLHILSGRLTDKPILMALPGPSLDIEYIRKNRSSFVLMACGRASQRLFEAGIDPDIAYIQDINALAWSMNFDSLGDRKTSTVLIANPAGRVWKYAKNFKRVFKAWNLYPFETDVFPRIEEIAPSTASGAYSVARLLGGNPLLMMGNDSGSNIEPSKSDRIPEALTNLNFEEDGDDLIFCPNWFWTDMYLRFGDEFSVTTQNDYIAGVQWLKMKAAQDMAQHGVQMYDFSKTGLCRFNSPILDGEDYQLGEEISFPEFPSYQTNYDMEKFLRHKKSTYTFLKRQLDKGVLPEAAWRFPNSCVLTNTTIHKSDNMETRPIDVQIARDNTAYILEHIEIAFEELAARPSSS